MGKIKYDIDKTVDTLTAHVQSTIIHPLETIESELFDGNVLFQVDSVTGELVKIVIYDFSVIRRQLLWEWVFLYTAGAIEHWLAMLISTFRAGHKGLRTPVQV
jgi:hypothetical protein